MLSRRHVPAVHPVRVGAGVFGAEIERDRMPGPVLVLSVRASSVASVGVDHVEHDAVWGPCGREEGLHRDVVRFFPVDRVPAEPLELSLGDAKRDPVAVERSREHGLRIGRVPVGSYLGRRLVGAGGVQLGRGDPAVAHLA